MGSSSLPRSAEQGCRQSYMYISTELMFYVPFGDVFPRESLRLVLKKLKLTQHNQSGTSIPKDTVPQNKCKLEMWANAQRDGCPAKYRWHPLFNAAKFGLTPNTRVPCSNGAKTRNRLKFAGVL